MVATSSNGTKFSVQDVGPAARRTRPRPATSIKLGPTEPAVAYTGRNGPMLAARSGGGWRTVSLDAGGGGYGISLGLGSNSGPFVAYYTKTGEVRLILPSAGGTRTLFRSAAGTKHPSGWSASVGVDKKGDWS